MLRSSRNGFSLVSIVIAVFFLGLIAGGIVFADSLIKSANAQKLVTKIANYDSAIVLFKNSYRDIPGDAKNITPKGDGNGYLNDQLGVCDLQTGKYLNEEKFQLWGHLSNVKILKDESYEAFSPKKCKGEHADDWAAVENAGKLWPYIEANGMISPIMVLNDRSARELHMDFKVNAEDVIGFERKFAELATAVNTINIVNQSGAGNCFAIIGQDSVPCSSENAAYAEILYYID